MDREEGFPPHIIGFMRRKRAKEQDQDKREQQPSSTYSALIRAPQAAKRPSFMFE